MHHMNPVIILLLRTQSATARLQTREHQQLYCFVFVRKSWMNRNYIQRNKVAGELQVPCTCTIFRATKILRALLLVAAATTVASMALL